MTQMTDAVHEFKRRYLVHMLTVYGGNRSAAARAIGIERTYLVRLVKAHGLASVFPASRVNGGRPR